MLPFFILLYHNIPMSDQQLVALIMSGLLILLIWGRWRYDGVVLVALALMVLLGLIEPGEAFSGFSHPAVITVALVLLISKGLEKSGFINQLGEFLSSKIEKEFQFMIIIMFTAAFLSSFMNNIGAMAMLLPITIGIAQKMDWNPSKFLMPLAFASILGGMNTKIGTPPNIIISEFREDVSGVGFDFFHFSFVGFPVSFIGIIFIAFLGWRLVRVRKKTGENKPLIDLQEYLIEMIVSPDSPWIGKRFHALNRDFGSDIILMGMVSEEGTVRKPHAMETLNQGDILVLKASPESVADIQSKYYFNLDSEIESPKGEELGVIEAMIGPRSRLIGRRFNYFKRMAGNQLSLLGLWRRGSKFRTRLAKEIFRSGDVLLLSGKQAEGDIGEKLELLDLLPLWQRDLDVIRDTSRVQIALIIFAICIVLVATNILNIIVAFLLCVLAFTSTRLLRGHGIYRHIDWPVVILLGAMIPIGGTLVTTGITEEIARLIVSSFFDMHVGWTLAIILIVTMFISDLINNAATAVIMAPLSISIANTMSLPVEPFLMSVAIGASCAFLSPIGHQCNTLVMGPGNYKFGDYWRLGLPLEIIIATVAVPALLIVWF